MELKDATLKDLFEERGELFDEIKEAGAAEIREELAAVTKELDELKEAGKSKAPDVQKELDKLRQDLADAERRSLIESKLRAAGLADVPEALQKALANCPSEDEVGALLEAFGEQQVANAGKPRSRPKHSAGLSRDQKKAQLKESWRGQRANR